MAVRQRETPKKRASGKPKSRKVFGHPGKPPKTTLRAGLYARVSTNDQQTLPMQNRALRDYAARRGWVIVMQVKEVGSGATQRPMREQLIDAARRREIDVVLVWRLDRWGRSVTDLLATMQELEHLGVGFVSLTEALDLTTPAGRAMAGLLAVFADYAEGAIMQSRSAEVAAAAGFPGSGAPHYPGSKSEVTNASGALNRPRRKASGTIASTASNFSDGSTRK
jgi:DNA invertase Pin-like site-specific DNA recombinase